jgi:hypothetical protein
MANFQYAVMDILRMVTTLKPGQTHLNGGFICIKK